MDQKIELLLSKYDLSQPISTMNYLHLQLELIELAQEFRLLTFVVSVKMNSSIYSPHDKLVMSTKHQLEYAKKKLELHEKYNSWEVSLLKSQVESLEKRLN